MQSERERLLQARSRTSHWRRWGPYLSERSWGNPREDYSADGTAWDYLRTTMRVRGPIAGPKMASRASATITSACASLSLFGTAVDPILKERLFGFQGPEGNHGEDVKEYYYYLDSTPTHSYMKSLYKYPQTEFPYAHLVKINRRAIARGAANMNSSIPGSSTRIVISTFSSSMPRRIRRYSGARHRCEPRARPGVSAFTSDGVVSQYLELGLRHAAPGVERLDSQPSGSHEQSLGEFKLWLEDAPPLLFTENESNAKRLWSYDSG